jgi:hypothetical protein
MTMIFFAEFPFDNICVAPSAEVLDKQTFLSAEKELSVTTDLIHERCDQTVTGRVFSVFLGGSVTRDSMNGTQQQVVQIYAYLVIGLTVILFVLFFGAGVVMGIYHLFYGSYSSDTDASEIKYSDCEIQAYIPFIRHASLAYPLICVDPRDFDPMYLAFELPPMGAFRAKFPDYPVPFVEDGGLYKVQSLYNKSELPGFSEDELREVFSQIKHYPPPPDLDESTTAIPMHDI